MDLTESLIKEREDMLREDSPGGRLLEDVAQEKAAADDERDTTAVHKALEGANTDSLPDFDAYDYVAEYRDGNNLQADPETGQHKLSNKNFRPHQVTIAGHDLATGEKELNRYEDVDGQISAGVSMLQDSHVDLDRGRPDTDAPALSRIAYALQMQGYEYEDFQRFNEGWSDATMVASWNAAMRGLARQEIENQLNDYAEKAEAGIEYPDEDELDWGYDGPDIDPDTLHQNADWLQACAIMHEWLEGKPPPQDAEELANWGKWQMAFFEMNTPAQALYVGRAASANDAQAWGLYKMMQMWTAVDMSAGGFGRGLVAVAADPLTYFTFGFGKLGTQAAAFAAKKAIMKALLSGTRGKMIGAATGAGISAANWSMLDETFRQKIAQDVGQQEGYNYGDIAIAGGVGFGIGGALGAGVAGVTSKEFAEMAVKLRGKAGQWWADEQNMLRRLATEEDGYIEIRAGKLTAAQKRMARWDAMSEAERAKVVEDAYVIEQASREPQNIEQAVQSVQILNQMPGMPNYKAKQNIKKKRTVKKDTFYKSLPKDSSRTWVNKYKTERGQHCVHHNGKVGMSIDFSTTCPRNLAGKGSCAYCYVAQGRQAAIQSNLTSANKGYYDQPYRGEVLEWPDSLIKALNSDGGIRMFSFGDFRPGIDDNNVANLLADAQKRGLYVKAITKEPELIKRFGHHPNLRMNLSIDAMPRAISNTMTPAEAAAMKAEYPNLRIRSVALSEEEAIKQLEDPRIDLVTLYHGPVKENLLAIIRGQNPKIFEMMDEKELNEYLMTWQSIGSSSSTFKKWAIKKYPGKVCCEGGKCSKDRSKCGFGLGMLILGVHLPSDSEDVFEGDQ